MAADADDDTEVLLLQGHVFVLLAAMRRRIERKKRKNPVFGFQLYLKHADDMEHTIVNLQFKGTATTTRIVSIVANAASIKFSIVTGSS